MAMTMDSIPNNEISKPDIKVDSEYRNWKKNTPYLYDTMITSSIPWPSLTVQWFPDVEDTKDGFKSYRLLLGTQTSGQGDEFVRIAHIKLPVLNKLMNPDKYDPDIGEASQYKDIGSKLEISQKILHRGEVNRARYMPQNPDILATFSSIGFAYIFDRSKNPLRPDTIFKAEAILKYHQKEGYGLSWNPHIEGQLITGSIDGKIALWDLTKFNADNRKMSPVVTYGDSETAVNEVEMSPLNENIFGYVSDNGSLVIHDTRTNSDTASVNSQSALNTLSFNKANEYLVATGGDDRDISLWDLRKLPSKLHTLKGHTGSIMSLEWSPHFDTVLASGSSDRKALIWDVSQIETPSTSYPPELLFIHGGHTDEIHDISWNPDEPWVVASSSQDNRLDIWKPADTIVTST